MALWSTKTTREIWLAVSKFWGSTVSWKKLNYTYTRFVYHFYLNKNFIKEKKTCCPWLHSLVKTSAKFVRILERMKTLDCISGFHLSTLKFSQTFASVFTKLWNHREYMSYFIILKCCETVRFISWVQIQYFIPIEINNYFLRKLHTYFVLFCGNLSVFVSYAVLTKRI